MGDRIAQGLILKGLGRHGDVIEFIGSTGVPWRARKLSLVTKAVALVVEYYDVMAGTLTVEFDGTNPNAAFGGAYGWIRGDL